MLDDRLGHPRCAGQRIADEILRLGLEAGDIIDMVLQIFADRWLVQHDIDIVMPDMVRWADAGQHQDLRTAEGARRQDHGAARVQRLGPAATDDLHTGDAAVLHDQLFGQAIGHHMKIGAGPDRIDIGARCRPALALLGGGLVDAEAGLSGAVEIFVSRQLQLRGAIHEGAAAGIDRMLVGYGQRAVAPMKFAIAALIGFAASEIGEDIVEGPAIAAHRGPIVIVPGVAPDIEHGVDRAGAAHAFSAGLMALPSIQALLRDRGVIPVREFGKERHHAGRVDAPVLVVAPRLDQTDADRGILGQPAGDRAARRSAADHDDIEFVHG